MSLLKSVFKLSFFAIFLQSLTCPAFSIQDSRDAKYILDNGLTVLVHEMPDNPMVSVYGLIRAGGATEGKYLGSGLSHFLEHLLFKGTETRGVGEIAKTIQAVGGSVNAQTSYDYTMFTLTVPEESFDVAVEILADALFHSTLDSVELEKERKVVFGEMRLRKDNPDTYLHDLMYRSVYLNHPYKHPVIGYPDLFGKVSREALYDFYKTYYTPNNMVISIAGGIDRTSALEKVSAVFGAYERSSPIPRNLPADSRPVSRRFIEQFYPTDLTRLAVAFQSVSLMDPDLFALDVLANILGQGGSSRLYDDLYRNKKLVYDISSYNYTPYDRGIFVIQAAMEDAKYEEVESEILGHIQKFQKKTVLPAELQKARKQVESDYVQGLQTTSGVAHSRAMDESLTGDYLFSQKYVEGIRAVTADDIKRVAQQYLRPESRTTVVLRPQKALQEHKQDQSAEQESPKIEKRILQNGMTILLKEDHSLPLVSIALVSAGGLLQESRDFNGIARLTAEVWNKGAGKRSAGEIAEFIDINGMSLAGFSGRNSMGLRMEFLSADFDKAIGLLAEIVKRPSFPQGEIEQSKQLLKVAIRQRRDDIFDFSNNRLKQLLFPGHPYAREEEGTPEILDRIARENIVDFYDGLIAPSNMVLAVYGDIDAKKAFEDIEKHFSDLRNDTADLAQHDLVLPTGPQEEQLTLDKEQALVLIGFRGADMKNPDVYGLEALMSILGSSFSGRLFNEVREELGKAYTVGGQFYPGIGTGGIVFYVLTTEADAVKVRDLITREIFKIQNDPVSAQELTAAASYLKGVRKSQQQTNGSMAFMTALDELYGLGFDRYESYDAGIDRVTAEDIMRLAKQYLNLTHAVAITTVPLKKHVE